MATLVIFFSNNGSENITIVCRKLIKVWGKQGQICIEIHKQFGMTAYTYPHSPAFFNVHFSWHHLPSLLPEPTQLIDEWVRVAHHSTTLPLPHRFHYIVILNYQQRWTGKDDWHIPVSGAAQAWLSSVFWQALLYAVPDRRGPAKCLAKGLH